MTADKPNAPATFRPLLLASLSNASQPRGRFLRGPRPVTSAGAAFFDPHVPGRFGSPGCAFARYEDATPNKPTASGKAPDTNATGIGRYCTEPPGAVLLPPEAGATSAAADRAGDGRTLAGATIHPESAPASRDASRRTYTRRKA